MQVEVLGQIQDNPKVEFDEAMPAEWGEVPRLMNRFIAMTGYNLFEQLASQDSLQLALTKHIPWQLVERYRRAAMRKADLRQLEDETWFVEIPDFEGVWASGEDMRECLNELDEVLLDWLLLKIEDEDKDIPLIDGIDLNVL